MTSAYTGVFWRTRIAKWVACITIEGRKSELGAFDDENDAAKCYDRVAFRYGRKTNILKFKPLIKGT